MSNETKHTPGPLTYGTTGPTMQGYSQPWCVATPNGNALIAGCFGDAPGGEESAKAYAQLFAAAPEMLEAIEDLFSQAETLYPEQWNTDKLRAAAAKAKGRA